MSVVLLPAAAWFVPILTHPDVHGKTSWPMGCTLGRRKGLCCSEFLFVWSTPFRYLARNKGSSSNQSSYVP